MARNNKWPIAALLLALAFPALAFGAGSYITDGIWHENSTVKGNATNVVNATFRMDQKIVNHQFQAIVNGTTAPVAGSFTIYVDAGGGKWRSIGGDTLNATTIPGNVRSFTGSYSAVLVKLTTAIKRAGNATTKIIYRGWQR